MCRSAMLSLAIFLVAVPAFSYTLEGTVREAGTRRAIPGASVFIPALDIETSTDVLGNYSLQIDDSDADRPGLTVDARDFGYVAASELLTKGTKTLDIYLEPNEETGTLVRERRNVANIARGAHHIEGREVNELPGTYGDPAKAIENFPGMGRVVRSQGSLLVRGAAPEDTAVFVDDFEIPDLYHFTGSTSVINIPFVESVQLVPGAFSARFGRATGGMVRIKTRKLPTDGFHGFGKFDVIDGGLYLGAPVTDELAVGASARRSWIDLGRNAQIAVTGARDIVLIPTYWDYQLKLDWDPSPGHEYVAFLFGSGDRELYTRDASGQSVPYQRLVDSDFHRLAFRAENRLGAGLKNRFNIVFGYERRLRDEQFGARSERGDAIDVQLREELTWGSDSIDIVAGIDATARYDRIALRGASRPLTDRVFPQPVPLIGRDAFSGTLTGAGEEVLFLPRFTVAGFLEGTWEPFDKLYITPGMRFDTYVYDEGVRLSVEPRISASYEFIPGDYGFLLKGAGGLFQQPPTALDVAASRLAGISLNPQSALHGQLGFEQKLGRGRSFSSTIYGVGRGRIKDRTLTFPANPAPFQTPIVDTTNGYSYGAEFLVRTGSSERYFAWVSYAIARHTRVDGETTESLPNAAAYPYPAPVDTSHLISAVAQTKLPWGFRVGARGRMATGMPLTRVTNSIFDSDTGVSVPVFGPRGADRFQTFYQLDLRIDWQYTFAWCVLDIYGDLVNVLNLRWTEGLLYNHDYSQTEPLLGLPTVPSLGFKVTW